MTLFARSAQGALVVANPPAGPGRVAMLWSALSDTDGPEVKWPPVLKVRRNGAMGDQLG